MQSYKRKITYFYQFHNGNVGSTAGFLKLEIRGDKVKIIINIQEPPGLPYKKASLYFYHEAGDHLAALKVDEIESVNGMLTYQTRENWQQLYDTGRDLYTFDGVAVMYNDSHYYIGDFQDKDRRDYKLIRKENRKPALVETAGLFGEPVNNRNEKEAIQMQSEERQEPGITRTQSEERQEPGTTQTQFEEKQEPGTIQMQSEAREEAGVSQTMSGKREEERIIQTLMGETAGSRQTADEKSEQQTDGPIQENVFAKCENCPYNKKRREKKEEDAFEKMIAEYPKLPMYGATELFQCVRIHPKDIGKLDMRNWKLGVNSFLTHGFYTYQYLLLGKMRFDDGSEHPIIGVPGVFSNREKYLANMFGFEQFIPVKKSGVKTGEFGYWIVEIN